MRVSSTKRPLPSLSSLALAAACSVARAADPAPATPPSPAPAQAAMTSPGLLNDWLHQQSPAFTPWDFGGQFRARYEVKQNGGGSRGAVPHRGVSPAGGENENSS